MTETPLLIGADVGTTGTKSILATAEGKILASAYRGYPTARRQAGYSEQDPRDWWQALVETVREVTRGTDRRLVAGICLSTQGGTLVPVDGAGEPLCRAIVWNDCRAVEEMELLRRELGEEAMYRKTGWTLGPEQNAAQILWLRRNEPELFGRAARFLSVPDYLSARLCGRAAVDPSNGGINQLMDIQAGRWDPEILAVLGIDGEQLGEIAASGEVIGSLTAEAAGELGLPRETAVVAGGHDQYCVALGAGAIHDRDILVASGTAWVLTAISAAPRVDLRGRVSYSRHTAPGMWGSLLSMGSGGVCLEWCRDITGANTAGPGAMTLQEMDALAAKRDPRADGPLFYPYFGGASYPAGARDAKAAFVGLELSHDRVDMARAVMEGVTCQLLWMLEAFPSSSRELLLAGGAAKSPFWIQLLADMAGRPVSAPAFADLGCVGAAILAGTGAGVFPSAARGCDRFAGARRTVEPDPAKAEVYGALLERFKRNAGRAREAGSDRP